MGSQTRELGVNWLNYWPTNPATHHVKKPCGMFFSGWFGTIAPLRLNARLPQVIGELVFSKRANPWRMDKIKDLLLSSGQAVHNVHLDTITLRLAVKRNLSTILYRLHRTPHGGYFLDPHPPR